MGLAIYLFGAPRIERNGEPLVFDTRKALALIAYLIVTGKAQARDTLAALLWPDYEQTSARATLRRTLSTLNKSLDGPWLDAQRERISLDTNEPLWCDVTEFQERLATSQSHAHVVGRECDTCLAQLTAAARLATDDFLAGFSLRDSDTFEEWQFFQREELRRRLTGALERLVATYTQRGDYEKAINDARRWLALDRLHEPAHRALMDLYACTGQYAAALHQYRECARILSVELGVAPLETTTRLYEAILKRRLETAPQTEAPTLPGALPGRAAINSPRVQLNVTPLAGRSQEIALLEPAYTDDARRGKLVVLDGEAGIGKTRLASEFLASVRARGAIIMEARCYAGEASLAYGPILTILRDALSQPNAAQLLTSVSDTALVEAARLAPELLRVRPALPPAAPLDSPGARSRFFDGALQTVCALSGGGNASARGVLFVDDAQWADSASLDVLTYLARRPDTYPLFTLLCWRRPEGEHSQRLRELLAEARRANAATLIPLERLDLPATRAIVRASLTDTPIAADPAQLEALTQRLYQETEGVPFFLVEYLNAARAGGLDERSAEWIAPGALRETLLTRARGVSETAWQALTAAALIGRSFDVDTLRAVSGRGEEETITALDELSANGLVNERRASQPQFNLMYDFGHEKVRVIVYDEVSQARRRLLHRRIASALVARNPRGLDILAAQIAAHYRAAGEDSDAAVYYKLAGERARALYANAEALTHLETALALGHPDVAMLREAIGDLRALHGDYSVALREYEAAALAEPGAFARLEVKISDIYARRGEWEPAEQSLVRALTDWGETGPANWRAHAYASWSLIARRQGATASAQEYASRALDLASQADDPSALAQAHNILGSLASGAGRYDEALAHLRESLALVEVRDDLSGRAAALNNLSLLHARRGEMREAISQAERALELCAAQGDRHREAALRTNLADRLRESGDLAAAQSQVMLAVAILAEIGADVGQPQPEIWKLTEW